MLRSGDLCRLALRTLGHLPALMISLLLVAAMSASVSLCQQYSPTRTAYPREDFARAF